MAAFVPVGRLTRSQKRKLDEIERGDEPASIPVSSTTGIEPTTKKEPARKKIKLLNSAVPNATTQSSRSKPGAPPLSTKPRPVKAAKTVTQKKEKYVAKKKSPDPLSLQAKEGQVVSVSTKTNSSKPIHPLKTRSKATSKLTREITPPERDQTPEPIDQQQCHIAQCLTRREMRGSRPSSYGTPAVWATGRQELCETLPYYKSYHGACYVNKGVIYSFMLDGAGQVREYMDENVIICRAGGSMESADGSTLQCKNHSSSDAQPQALLNNMLHQNPVIIICGDRNTAAAVDMPHRYCVLGWFKATHVWSEMILGKGNRNFVSVKYRFERLDQSNTAWYAPIIPALNEDQELLIPTMESRGCAHCGKISPTAMLSGWMCLNDKCEQFWRLNGKLVSANTVRYTPAFLRHKTTPWSIQVAPFDINPGVPRPSNNFGESLHYINTRGIVCPDCGRCNQRYLFTGWVCDTKGCHWSLPVSYSGLKSRNMNHDPWDIVSDGPALTKSTSKDVVKVEVRHTHNYKVSRYTIPGIEGCVVHAKANRTIVEERGGPDDMFQALQAEDIGLIRRAFVKHSAAKTQLASQHSSTPGQPDGQRQAKDDNAGVVEDAHGTTPIVQADTPDEIHEGRMISFSNNFGMPYKFVAGVDSQSFDNSAWPIRACRSRLNWALRTFLGETDLDKQFNELLAIGYLERQKINYHDDGEAGLGPVIATLSLGSAATMSLRLKAKYFSSVSKAGCFTYEHLLPLEILQHSSQSHISQAQWDERVAAFKELQAIKATKTKGANFMQRSKELPKELGLKCRFAQPLLELHLTHGDIVLMQGEAVQKYFEHAVEPHGSLRFALTCRQILPDHLTDSQKPAYEVAPDNYGYDGQQIRCETDTDIMQW